MCPCLFMMIFEPLEVYYDCAQVKHFVDFNSNMRIFGG